MAKRTPAIILPRSRLTLRADLRYHFRGYSATFFLCFVYLCFAVLTRGVNLSGRNISNIFVQNGHLLILSAGMTMVLIVGHIDLSVGSVCAFTGALGAILYQQGLSMLVVVLAVLALGAAIGFGQGAIISYLRLPSFIVTLVGMLLFRGLTYVVTDASPISLAEGPFRLLAGGFLSDMWPMRRGWHLPSLYLGAALLLLFLLWGRFSYLQKRRYQFHQLPYRYTFAKHAIVVALLGSLVVVMARYQGLPYVLILLLLVVAVFSFLLHRSVVGRCMYAVGGSERAARMAGINTPLVVAIVYGFMGMLAGLAGLVFASYLNSAQPQAGQLFELEAIAATFIGGASAAGGVGSIIGGVVGGLVIAVVNNGISLLSLGMEYQHIVKAMILLLAVLYDVRTRRLC